MANIYKIDNIGKSKTKANSQKVIGRNKLKVENVAMPNESER